MSPNPFQAPLCLSRQLVCIEFLCAPPAGLAAYVLALAVSGFAEGWVAAPAVSSPILSPCWAFQAPKGGQLDVCGIVQDQRLAMVVSSPDSNSLCIDLAFSGDNIFHRPRRHFMELHKR